jgi:hypothetical protein
VVHCPDFGTTFLKGENSCKYPKFLSNSFGWMGWSFDLEQSIIIQENFLFWVWDGVKLVVHALFFRKLRVIINECLLVEASIFPQCLFGLQSSRSQMESFRDQIMFCPSDFGGYSERDFWKLWYNDGLHEGTFRLLSRLMSMSLPNFRLCMSIWVFLQGSNQYIWSSMWQNVEPTAGIWDAMSGIIFVLLVIFSVEDWFPLLSCWVC